MQRFESARRLFPLPAKVAGEPACSFALDDSLGRPLARAAGAEKRQRGCGDAGVVELADTQDLKSCGGFPRTGSIPVPGTDLVPLCLVTRSR